MPVVGERTAIIIAVVFSLFVLGSMSSVAFASSMMWSQIYGGQREEVAYSLVEAPDGGFVMAGYTSSYGAGNFDFWLVKTNEFGKTEWNKTYGGTQLDIAYSLVATSDGGYALAGTTESFDSGGEGDFWLVKTDEYGNMEWSQAYGGPNSERAYSLIETADGGYTLAGGKRLFDNRNRLTNDIWLVKTDNKGNMEWNQTFATPRFEEAYSVVQTSDGGYALAGGALLVKIDAYGNIEWNTTISGMQAYSLVETSNGGYAIAGSNPLWGGMWLVETNSTGGVEWFKTYPGGNFYSLVETLDDGFAIVGYVEPHREGGDFLLVKTDKFGVEEWNQTYGGIEHERAYALVETSEGGYAIAGYISYSSFDPDAGWFEIFLTKTDEYGDIPEFSSWTQPLLVIVLGIIICISIIFRRNLHRKNQEKVI